MWCVVNVSIVVMGVDLVCYARDHQELKKPLDHGQLAIRVFRMFTSQYYFYLKLTFIFLSSVESEKRGILKRNKTI